MMYKANSKTKKVLALSLCGVIGFGSISYGFNELTLTYKNHYESIKTKLENFVNDSNSTVNQLKNDKSELQITIENHLVTISQKEARIEELQAIIEQMEADGNTQDEIYNALLAEKQGLEAQVAELEVTIESLNLTITEKDSQIAELQQNSSDKDDQIEYYLNVIAQFETDSEKLETDVDTILAGGIVDDNEEGEEVIVVTEFEKIVNNVNNEVSYDLANTAAQNLSPISATDHEVVTNTKFTDKDGSLYYIQTVVPAHTNDATYVMYDSNGNKLTEGTVSIPLQIVVSSGKVMLKGGNNILYTLQ